MTVRSRLPNRRACEIFEFRCENIKYTASVGRYPDGRVSEIFINNGKAGSSSETNARDAAIIASIALQHGVEVDTIRSSISRASNGRALGPLGAVLDLLENPNGANG